MSVIESLNSLGLTTTNHNSKEHQADCPFCESEQRLYVNEKSSKWNCRRCDESGNLYTFMTLLYKVADTTYAHEDLKALARDRGLSTEDLWAAGIRPNPLTFKPRSPKYILPSRNSKRKIVNLYRIVKMKQGDNYKWKAFGTKHLDNQLFTPPKFRPGAKPLYIGEGPWDMIALTKLVPEGSQVLCLPGAGFNPSWMPLIKESTSITLCFDSDHPKPKPAGGYTIPGLEHTHKVANILAEHLPRVPVKFLKWGAKGYSKSKPSGYDITDMLQSAKKLTTVQDRFVTMLAPISDLPALPEGAKDKVKEAGESKQERPPNAVTPIPRNSFYGLCRDFDERLHFTPEMRDTLAVMCSCILSTPIPGDQLWFRVIGPPGSGKSTLAEAVSASTLVFPVSVQTGFHSGWKQGGEDASIIAQANNRCVTIKDADTLVTAPNRDRILGEMRDIFDGVSRAHYRNRVSNIYDDIKMTFLLCGTDELRKLNKAAAGDRFLDIEILPRENLDGDGQVYDRFIHMAIDNTYNAISKYLNSNKDQSEDSDNVEPSVMDHLKAVTAGFLETAASKIYSSKPPLLTQPMHRRLKAMGRVLAATRARVQRERGEESPIYRPRAELPTRLANQLTKLSTMLAIILEKDHIDEECFYITRKVLEDTAWSYEWEILQYLHRNGGTARTRIAKELDLGATTVLRKCRDLRSFKMLRYTQKNNGKGNRGRNIHVWDLAKRTREDMDLITRTPNLRPKKIFHD